MSIAYLISAYRLPRQLSRLVQRLRTPSATFLIHLDARVDAQAYFAQAPDVLDDPQVHLVDRVPSPWGGFGHVAASLNGIRYALDHDLGFDHLALMTGQDYPIVPAAHIEARVAQRPGACYMEHHPVPRPGWPEEGGLERLERHSFAFLRRRWTFPNRFVPFFPRRRIPAGLTPYVGGSYWWLSRPCVEYVRGYLDEHPEVVRHFRRSVFAPDEHLFHMVVLNGPFAGSVVNDDLRFTRWHPGTVGPAVLTAEDIPAMAASGALVARKFDEEIDARVLDRIDAELLGLPA